MNKTSKVLLCAALTGAMAVGAAGAADLGSPVSAGCKGVSESDHHPAE